MGVVVNSFFIGRKSELVALQALHAKPLPSLVVVKGRRRIGKSRLIQEFAAQASPNGFWSFAGLAPQEGVGAQEQRDHFARELALHSKGAPCRFTDWSDAFEQLGAHCKPGDVILLDEISWMAAKDPTFIPKLKAWWDKQRAALMLVFCGSVSTWIEENIINSTAFFGRVHLTLSLEPFSITESSEMLKKLGMQLSDYDAIKLLSVLGGIPWYLLQCVPSLSADDNIKRLAFEPGGLLVTEFDRIFHDLFTGKGASYKKILDCLKEGACTLAEIREALDFSHSGTLSLMMEHLVTAGFVHKQTLWSFKTTDDLKQSLYRISDPYMRFYLKVIEPNMSQIADGAFRNLPLSTLPGFDTHIALQVEVLLLQNRGYLLHKIGISPIDVVRSGPYRQVKNATQQGCQIDFLVQSKTNTLYICEFKFKRREVDSSILDEMQEKMARLKTPKGFAKVPILVHSSGVSAAVATSTRLYRIIDITDFLQAD